MILGMHAAVRSRVRDVLADLYGLDADRRPDVTLQYPPDREMGDLGVTVAFELARVLRKAPRAIATEIVGALGPIDGVDRVEPAPNGYVNIFFDRARFARLALGPPPSPADRGIRKAIVEHTAINPNKAAHVGHLRNAALGDTLVRLLRFLGIPVEVQNYIDDTGVQVADVVVGFRHLEKLPPEEVAALAGRPRFDYYCWDLYARVTAWYEDDPDRLALRAGTLHDLEAGAAPTAGLGQLIADRIVRCHLATMDRMNIEYDLLTWEGDILRLHFWTRAFEVLKETGAVRLESTGPQAGCWVMPLDADSPSREDAEASDGGPKSKAKVIVRSNGTVTYVGKDIAYQFWKLGVLERDFHYRLHGAQRSGRQLWSTTSSPTQGGQGPGTFGSAEAVYNVIDTRQAYLQQLLKQALTAVGRSREAERSVHVSYEMVALSPATARALGHDLDTDAERAFVEVSGRKGLGVKADDLLDRLTAAARREVLARHADLSDDGGETDVIANAIATAAIRYFMIKYSRGKLIAFDIDEALSFEGESGPYVQYAAVRATNILRKLYDRDGLDDEALIAKIDALPAAPLEAPGDGTATWSLLLESARLDEVADQSIRALELSVLAKYAFGLAQMFNTFYHRCPVVAEEDEPTRLWRAAAVLYCRLQLTRTLALMGCEVPPRM
jgi:arginyl-tRNA synthetase